MKNLKIPDPLSIVNKVFNVANKVASVRRAEIR